MDSGDPEAQFPVLIATHEKPETSWLTMSFCKTVPEHVPEAGEPTLDMFPYLSVNLQPFSILLDFGFINTISKLVEAWMRAAHSSQDIGTITAVQRERQEELNKELSGVTEPIIINNDDEITQYFFFENLELHPVKLHVTFMFTKDDSVTQEDQEEDEKQKDDDDDDETLEFELVQDAQLPNSLKGMNNTSQNNPLMIILDSVGVTVANVDDAPLCLNAMLVENVFENKTSLIDRMSQHYIRSVMKELYKVLGSLEMLGNPVGLFNDVSTGVKDLFYEPVAGLSKNPEQFGKLLAKGSVSLVSNSVHGTFNAASKVTGTIGKGLTYLTFDDEYIKKHQAQRRAPRDAREGLSEGGNALFRSVKKGVTGLITQPIKGAKEQGGKGFFAGLGKGIVGVPMKPIAGVFDLVNKTTQGISNQAASQERQNRIQNRIRYPRTFKRMTNKNDAGEDYTDMMLSVYEANGAYEMFLLQIVNDGLLVTIGMVPDVEYAIYHLMAKIGKKRRVVYILTNKSVMKVIDCGTEADIRWRCELNNLKNVNISKNHKDHWEVVLECGGLTNINDMKNKKNLFNVNLNVVMPWSTGHKSHTKKFPVTDLERAQHFLEKIKLAHQAAISLKQPMVLQTPPK
ncbi:vacuolar protein sorting protein VPS13 [Acrasis kona]|uniref:Vacuolar protein sorting protein VPS13 n=1 Tax=Acrasis kona TaxID=1008807 RepID=A0AAW2YNZ6_9EUKA